ncbi:type I pullulanase [Paenibacillus sp.]|uniref:type I pullulanase n=1 Tax=Paenibacillus sp. TaxID=58172 RepID=UPI002811D4C9|nr:type I pullulanase [Paenibacillus sp.]
MFMQTERARVIVHYYRFDENYEQWNVWAWPDGAEGRAFPFGERDAFGARCVVDLHDMAGVTRIGFLLRRSAGGDDWAEREVGHDRYVEELDERDAAEVWVVEGDERLYTDAELAWRRRRPRVVEATMTSPRTIRATINRRPSGDRRPEPTLTTADGAVVPVVETVAVGPRAYRIETAAALSVLERYVVRFGELPEANVTLRGRFDDPEFERQYAYDGDDLGATYAPDETTFRLWAPTAEKATLALYSGGSNDAAEERTMTPSRQGTWMHRLPGDRHGLFYTYKVLIDGEWREAVDPYARSLSANGRRGAVIDPARAAPDGWAAHVRPPLSAATDAVLYELHVRDATMHPDSGASRPGTFLGLAEEGTRTQDGLPTGVDYLSELGVTHIQLLPVNDFVSVDETDRERLYNWGYDPAFWFSPEGSYATDPQDPAARVRELKTLIQALHGRGLRVTLDVVFNHAFSAARSALEKLVPGYYFRTEAGGRAANGTGVGNDTASERAMMRKLIVDAISYWAREYRVDGFRFDLMGIHDVETIRLVRERLDDVDETILLYGEGWVLDTPLPEERKAALPNARLLPRVGFFHDRFRDGVRGGVFDAAERGFVGGEGARAHDVWTGVVGGIDYGRGISGHAAEPEQTINYVEVHDNHTLWDRLALSNGGDDDATRAAMQRLAAALLLTSQGIPLLHAGQEWLRTKRGEHNSYRSPDEVNRLDWKRATCHREHIGYVRGLLALRRSHGAFRLPTAEAIRSALRIVDSPAGVIAYTLQGPADDRGFRMYAAAFNALTFPASLRLPEGGRWLSLCDGSRASDVPFAAADFADGLLRIPPLSAVILCKS